MKACTVILAIVLLSPTLIDYAEAGSIAEKIPKAFFCKIQKICDNIDEFADCMMKNSKKITKEDTDRLRAIFEKHQTCQKMPDCKDTVAFKAYLCELAKIEEIVKALEGMASEVKTLMKCTK